MDNVLYLLQWIPEPFGTIIRGILAIVIVLAIIGIVKKVWDMLPFA